MDTKTTIILYTDEHGMHAVKTFTATQPCFYLATFNRRSTAELFISCIVEAHYSAPEKKEEVSNDH